MSNDMNKVIFVGTLVSNPESKDVNGLQLCNFWLETKHVSQSGREEVAKFLITVFSGQAASCMLYLKNGSRAMIEGRMKYDERREDTNSGWAVAASTVVFLDQKDK